MEANDFDHACPLKSHGGPNEPPTRFRFHSLKEGVYRLKSHGGRDEPPTRVLPRRS